MKLERTLGFVLGATLIPTLALADDPNDPYAPQPTPTAQQPAEPTTTTTTTVVTPPAQPVQQPPVVVVNPQPEPPRTTVVTANPEGAVVTETWNAPLFTTGAIVFAGTYGASAIVAATSDHVGADRLYVPIVGPWLALNDWGNCPIDQPRCDENTADKVLLIADGVFQAAGVATMLTGLFTTRTHTVYARTANKTIKVTPTHNGFAVFGRF